MKRPLTIWCLVAASLVGVAAWADLVLVFKTEAVDVEAPIVSSPAAQLIADEGAISFTPTLTNSAENVTWTAENLPTGASINSETGAITGTLSTLGKWVTTVTATNELGSCEVSLPVSVYGSTDEISTADSFPFYCSTANRKYTLTEDITANGTAIAIIAQNVSVDLNGHTITYNNAAPRVIANASFETAGATADLAANWDFTNAGSTGAERYAGTFLLNETYDGDYSIRFPTATATGYIESSGTVTLEANTTYSLSAMFEYGGSGDTDNPGVKGYVRLVGDGLTTREAFLNGTNYRGIQHVENTFTTGGTDETYSVRVGIEGHASATKPFYIDDVKVQRRWYYGVAVTPKAWNPGETPGVTQYGDGNKATITNGSIVQGQDNGTWSHAVFVYQTQTATVENVDITVQGANTSAVYGREQATYAIDVLNCTITSNVKTVTSRDNMNGAVIFGSSGEKAHNTIMGGPHVSIRGGSAGNNIHNNTFAMKSRYTNAFAISVDDAEGYASLIYDNVIDNSGADNAGAGIILSGTGATKVYDNTLTVKLLPNNQEYQGPQIYGAYGIQLEAASNKEVHNNTVTVLGADAGGVAFRLGGNVSVPGANNNVHDNEFIATQQNSSYYVQTAFISNQDVDSNLTLLRNTFRTNDTFLRGSNLTGIVFDQSTFEATGNLDSIRVVEVFDYIPTDTTLAVRGVVFLDSTYADVETESEFTNGIAELYGRYAEPEIDNDSWFSVAWTSTLTIQGDSTPLASTAVSIQDDGDTEVFSGTTNGSGVITPKIKEFTTTGETKDTHNPHAVIVSGYAEGALTVDELGETATINLTSE